MTNQVHRDAVAAIFGSISEGTGAQEAARRWAREADSCGLSQERMSTVALLATRRATQMHDIFELDILMGINGLDG